MLKKDKIIVNNKVISFLWIVASIIEWMNVILFIAAMGYNFIDFPLYNSLKDWQYINTIFYISAFVDALIFWLLAIISKKTNRTKDTLTAVYCGVIQLVLLIYKVKL